MGRAACRCAEPALTLDRAFGRSGTLLLTEKRREKKKHALHPNSEQDLACFLDAACDASFPSVYGSADIGRLDHLGI